MTKNISPGLWMLRFQWLMTVLVFFVFPFLLLTFGAGIIWTSMEKDSVDRQFNRLDNMLLTISRKADTKSYLKNLLFSAHALGNRNPGQRPTILTRAIRSLQQRFPGIFTFAVTDSQGIVLPTCSNREISPDGIRNFFLFLRKKARGFPIHPRMASEFLPQLKDLITLPDLIPIFSPEISSTFFWEVVSQSGNRHFFFADIHRDGGFFTIIRVGPDWETLGIRDLLARFNRLHAPQGVVAGFFDPQATESFSSELLLAYHEFEKFGAARLQTENTLHDLNRFGRQSALWIKVPRKTAMDFTDERLLLSFLGAILVALLSFLSARIIVGRAPFTLPLRIRLVLLFTFTAGLPLLAILLAGLDYLKKMEGESLQRADSQAQDMLRRFDHQYDRMFFNIESDFSRVIPDLTPFLATQPRELANHLFPLYSRNGVQSVELYRADGASLAKLTREKNTNDLVNAQLKSLCMAVLKELNHENPPKESVNDRFEFETGQPSNQAASLIRHLGRILDLNPGSDQYLHLFLPLKNRAGRYEFILLAQWKKVLLAQYYIQRNLPNLQRINPQVLFYSAIWIGPTLGQSDLPRNKFFLRPSFMRLINSMRMKDRGESAQIHHLGRGYLLTGWLTKELAGACLIAVQSQSNILHNIRAWKMGLGFFAGMVALVAVFFGLMLSQRFLHPITHLTRGVEAIKQRTFKFRVPEGDPDELGNLARTFNEVMDGLSELEVGRIIQESFFPSGDLELGEYRIFAKTIFASRLSGDYYDLQLLPDKKVLFLIGDVTGHGVGAALVMSMAKGLVQKEIEGVVQPEKLLLSIHQVLVKAMKKRTIMSACVGVLDTVNHTLCLANAGHPFPYLFRQKSPPHQLSFSSPPLAVRPNQKFFSQTIELQPGDMFFFYTDGILEAMTASGPVNYHRMTRALTVFADRDPKKTWEAFFKWHSSITLHGPQGDDMTAIFINRK